MNYTDFKVTEDVKLKLYKSMLKPRMVEEKMLILLRQGKISKWFSGIGQEAISVGVTSALKEDEYVLPMHRNLGVLQPGKFHYIDYLRNGKVKLADLHRVGTVAFILAHKISRLSV